MTDLLTELECDCVIAQNRGRRNRHFSFACLAVALLTSLATTLLVATDYLPKLVLAILTAVPGTALLANSVFRFDTKARWWWAKYHHLRGFRYQLLYEGRQPKDVSLELRTLLLDLEKTYPGFGSLDLRPERRSANE